MPSKKITKTDEVTISFHYITRIKKDNEDNEIDDTISQIEFDEICDGLRNLKSLNVNDPEKQFDLKTKHIVPVDSVDQIDKRSVCGIFLASYWGHAYKNSEKGNISADSINLRPFYYYLYLSDNGQIYIACQYLGNYGSYTALKNTLLSQFKNKNNLKSRSVNADFNFFDNLTAKEIEFRYVKNPTNAFSKTNFGRSKTIAYRENIGEPNFNTTIKKNVLSLLAGNKTAKQKQDAVSRFINENGLTEIDDFELENCKVLVQFGNSTKTFQILRPNQYATRFPIDVKVDTVSGHPVYIELKNKVPSLFKKAVLSRKADD